MMARDTARRPSRFWFWYSDHVPGGTWGPLHDLTRLLFCRPCTPERDMCGLPEHDYCVCCGRPMPGQARRSVPTNPSRRCLCQGGNETNPECEECNDA